MEGIKIPTRNIAVYLNDERDKKFIHNKEEIEEKVRNYAKKLIDKEDEVNVRSSDK